MLNNCSFAYRHNVPVIWRILVMNVFILVATVFVLLCSGVACRANQKGQLAMLGSGLAAWFAYMMLGLPWLFVVAILGFTIMAFFFESSCIHPVSLGNEGWIAKNVKNRRIREEASKNLDREGFDGISYCHITQRWMGTNSNGKRVIVPKKRS